MRRKFFGGVVVILLLANWSTVHPPPAAGQDGVVRRVHVPYFDGYVHFVETAIFWFGRVTPTENHGDVRVGYNDNHLYLRLAAFDRRLWYDKSPSPEDLTAWDAATLYLNLDGNAGNVPDVSTYRFEAQLVWWESRHNYQAAYRGDGSGWVTATLPFTTTSVWRGNAPNDDLDDRGWTLSYYIPFDNLGLSGPPAQGTVWGMALALHDRDDSNGTPIADKVWPETMEPQQPSTWGQLVFGMPTYSPPSAVQVETLTIRQGLNDALVPDADVGGGSLCGAGLDFWTEWGEANYAGEGDLNIQNQADVADWPCFSKYYVTFPLDALPPGRAVLSATLTVHKFGHAGAAGQAQPSLIQVLTVAEDWDETTLSWNNAPLAVENIAATWVAPLPFPGWPGTPFTWDVSGATAESYALGTPLRLVLYEADSAYHSGKYFVSSDSTIAEGRPTLRVSLGAPPAVVHKEVQPVAPVGGQMITYTLTLLGNGQALTLTDSLPAQVSPPGPIQVSDGSTVNYDGGAHLLTWSNSLSVGQAVTVTFPVTVQVAGPLTVSNTAVLTDAEGHASTSTATLIVDAYQVRLPLVMQGQ